MEHDLVVKIQNVVRWDYFWVILSLSAASWAFYKVALTKLSHDRHLLFDKLFKELWSSLGFFIVLFCVHKAITTHADASENISAFLPYTGLITIFIGATQIIRTFKIIANEYFFFTSMKEGVPVLLVNVCSLILSLMILGWSLTTLFNVQVASLFATSAVLTIVLGLALQDTLGNLFAAISLQIDKPFELDDWIEVKSGSETIAGQVKELSWRATVLLAMTDEYITIPNRTLAQWQIVNFSAKSRPFFRRHTFRLPFTVDLEKARAALLAAARANGGIATAPPPLALVVETTESWISLRVVYAIHDYGMQYITADKFYEQALENLSQAGITLASPRLQLDRLSQL